MSGETYSIYVKVDSTQARKATEDLDDLAKTSVSVEVSLKNLGKSSSDASNKIADATKAVKQLGNEYRNTAGIIDSSGIGAKLGMAMGNIVKEAKQQRPEWYIKQQSEWIQKLGKSAESSVLWITKLSSASASASGALENIDASMHKAAGGMNTLSSAAKNLHSAFVLVVGIEMARALREGVNALKDAADAYTDLKSQLDLATYSQDELNKAFTASIDIANRYYKRVEDVASAYAKFNPIVASLGRNTDDTAKIVSSLSASLLISSKSTVDASESFRQFAQAISGPNVQMEEMNTLIDSNQALWRGLQREFPGLIAKYGTLKEAISKQALTNEMLIDATIRLGGEFEALAARKVPTITNAMTVLHNSFVQYVGEVDDASGASTAFAGIILDLAEALRNAEGSKLGDFMQRLAQAMAGANGIAAELGDRLKLIAALMNGISNPKGVMEAYAEVMGLNADPRLMAMGQGKIPIDELAAARKPTTQPQLTPKGTKTDAKQAAKDAKDAEAAFKALIDAQISAASNSEKIFAANSANIKKRYELEADQIEGLAELKIRATKSETMRVAIAEEAQAKIIESINRETELRQAGLDKEIETTATKLAGVQQEMDAADAHKLKQAERIELTTRQAELETELSVKRAERTQIELDAIGKIQNADQKLAEARQQANEALVKEEALRQLEIMSSNLEYAKEMATGLADAFGEVGAAIGGMSVAMAEYDKQSATIEIARKEAVANAEGDQKRIAEINDDAAKKQSRAQIKSYGDMTKAAQGFFKKGTAGYEAMGAASKVFRAFEMAQSAMSFAQQLGDMNKLFGSFETMLKEMGILSDINRTKEVVNAQIAGNAKAAEGAANQGSSGDPYTAFARVAAWVALMASIGFMVGGAGGSGAQGVSVTDIQKKQDEEFQKRTATMLGSSESSTSILDALEILAENSTNDLDYTKGMARNMELLVGSIESLSTAIATSFNFDVSKLNLGTVSNPRLKHVGLPADPLMGAIVGGIIGGTKVNRSLIDQGIHIFEQTLGSIIDAGVVKASQYANVLVTKTDKALFGMFSSTSQKIERETSKLDPVLKSALGQVLDNAYATLIDAGEFLGKGSKEFANVLKNYTIKNEDLKLGKNAEKNAEKIRAWVSSELDRLVETAVPELKEFRRAGEGMFETSIRVADGVAQAEQELMMLGMTAIKYTDIVSDQKDQIDIGTEITRQTILAQADLSKGTRQYVEELKGSAKDVASAYGQIANISATLRGAGFGEIDVDKTMINAAGGLSEFEAAMESFRQNFMTDAQRVNADTVELAQAFGKLGYEMPKSKDEFFKIALGMDKTTEEGKKLFGQFMKLNPAFSELTDAAKELADAQAEAQQKILDGLQKNVDSAFSSMQKAYQDLQKVQDRFLNYSKNIRAYLDELTGGKSAYISPEERYRIARQEFQRVSTLAATGNESALTEITKAGKDFLDASREYNASSQQFQDDFSSVTSALEASAGYAEAQANLVENQLRVAESSYSALVAINTNTIGVQSAISALNATMAAYAAAVGALAAGKITSTPGVITTGGGEVVYNPAAPVGSPTNPIPVARPTLVRPIARAIGGTMPAGVSLVGEYGPELISSGGGYVSTAGATANFFKTIKDAVVITSAEQTALLKEQIGELQALVRLQSAANRELITQLSEIRNETAESTRIAKVEASA